MRKKITLLLIMGLFSKLFGQTEKNSSDSKVEKELKLEFKVMKNITLEKCEKYENTGLYELVENGIYRDLKDEDDAKYRMTISYELESNETNGQYPLEDIFDPTGAGDTFMAAHIVAERRGADRAEALRAAIRAAHHP